MRVFDICDGKLLPNVLLHPLVDRSPSLTSRVVADPRREYPDILAGGQHGFHAVNHRLDRLADYGLAFVPVVFSQRAINVDTNPVLPLTLLLGHLVVRSRAHVRIGHVVHLEPVRQCDAAAAGLTVYAAIVVVQRAVDPVAVGIANHHRRRLAAFCKDLFFRGRRL